MYFPCSKSYVPHISLKIKAKSLRRSSKLQFHPHAPLTLSFYLILSSFHTTGPLQKYSKHASTLALLQLLFPLAKCFALKQPHPSAPSDLYSSITLPAGLFLALFNVNTTHTHFVAFFPALFVPPKLLSCFLFYFYYSFLFPPQNTNPMKRGIIFSPRLGAQWIFKYLL